MVNDLCVMYICDVYANVHVMYSIVCKAVVSICFLISGGLILGHLFLFLLLGRHKKLLARKRHLI